MEHSKSAQPSVEALASAMNQSPGGWPSHLSRPPIHRAGTYYSWLSRVPKARKLKGFFGGQCSNWLAFHRFLLKSKQTLRHLLDCRGLRHLIFRRSPEKFCSGARHYAYARLVLLTTRRIVS